MKPCSRRMKGRCISETPLNAFPRPFPTRLANGGRSGPARFAVACGRMDFVALKL